MKTKEVRASRARWYLLLILICISDSEWGKHVFPAMIRLQKLCNHPGLLSPNIGKDKKKSENTAKYKSEKQFEKIAFGTPLAFSKLTTSGQEEEQIRRSIAIGDDVELSGKMKVLDALLQVWKEEGSKVSIGIKSADIVQVLLFSNSTRMMDILAKFLKKNKYTHSRIDGSTPMKVRTQLVDVFSKSRSQFVFLMSTKVRHFNTELT